MKTYNQFVNTNESWRQVKSYLKIPEWLINLLFSKLFNLIPSIKLKYDEYSAKYDIGSVLDPIKVKEHPIKIELDDISNKKLKNTLKITGFFKKWNIYTFDRLSYDNRSPVYISKDEIKQDDLLYGGRINDTELTKKYGSRYIRRYLKSKNVSSISDIEPQFYVIVSKHTSEHEKMKKERNKRQISNKYNNLTKLTNNVIKNDLILHRTNGFQNEPIMFKIIKSDRLDLAKKVLDNALDDEERYEIIMMVIDEDNFPIGTKKRWKNERKLIDEPMSINMKDLLNSYL
jgi:hypothetical protein